MPEGVGEGPLERLMGSFASTKILDFLSTFREFDYSITDISRNSGLSRRTVQRELPRLTYYNVIQQSRTVGRAHMYRINIENPITTKLNELISEIAKFDSDRILIEGEEELQVTPIAQVRYIGEVTAKAKKKSKIPVVANEGQ